MAFSNGFLGGRIKKDVYLASFADIFAVSKTSKLSVFFCLWSCCKAAGKNGLLGQVVLRIRDFLEMCR